MSNVNSEKKCSICKEILPISSFVRKSSKTNEYRAACKKCRAEKWRERWKKNHPEARENSKTGITATSTTLEYHQQYKRLVNYKITIKETANLLEKQKGCCAICKIAFVNNNFHVDHCHNSNQVRGLLCGNCNWGIGLFKDNPSHLVSAAKYLRKHG